MKQDFFESGVIYHVFNRGNNLEDIFIEEKNYSFFLSLMKKYLLPAADIYAFCLLKNHFHLALRIKDDNLLIDKLKQNLSWLFQICLMPTPKPLTKPTTGVEVYFRNTFTESG